MTSESLLQLDILNLKIFSGEIPQTPLTRGGRTPSRALPHSCLRHSVNTYGVQWPYHFSKPDDGPVNNMKEDIITSLKADINTVVDARNKELEDRKCRDMNLTVFNLQEHNFGNGPDNKRADENDILRICSSLGLETPTINYSYRLGKKVESKTRPLKLVLDSKAQRKFLLDNARFVQTKADDNYKRVIITKDLTPAQRWERREKIAKIRAQRRSNQSSSRNTPKAFSSKYGGRQAPTKPYPS